MENKILIQYKWQHGVYQLKDMIKMVESDIITKEDFFYITRFDFDGIIGTYCS